MKFRCIPILKTILLAIVLQGCDSAKLEPINDGTILAFGDSLTSGVGVSEDDSYPSVLAELTDLTVINSGVSGETSAEGLERLPGVLDRTSPDLMVLIEGGNDILRNTRQAEIKNNIKAMIELARSRGIQVVLLGVPEKSLFSNSAPLYEELAEEFQLVFDGALIADLQKSPSLKSDSVHFNKKGYRKMAETVYELLADNGAM